MRRSVFHRVFPLAAVLFCIAAGRSADEGAAIRDAVAAMDRGDFPSAERTLRAELQARPRNAAALSLLGAALDNQKKFPEADEFHRRAVANAPRDADVQSNYGNHLLMGAGDEKGAREAYLKATAIDPANPNANLQLARLALNQENGPEALSYLKRLPAKQQQEPNAVVLRLQALYVAGDRAEGDALVERLSSTAQGDPSLSYSMGLALGKAGQFDKAETFLLRALAADPSDIDVLYHTGIAASFAGDNRKARDIFETALRQQPKNVDVLYGLAWVDHALKQREAAILLLAQAAQIAPQRADVQKLLAITTAEVSALQDSIAAWDRYLKLEPGDDSARCERGLVAIRSGQFDEGIADLQWFIARHPGDATGYFYLGLGESGADQDQALKDIDKALALKPDLVEARSARGYLYYQLGKPEGALADLEFAAAHGPDDPVTLDRLGQTYVALDRSADAVKVLRKAAELAPNESTTELHFARALADAGQTAEAAAAMDRFRQLGPAKSTAVPGGLVQYLSLTPEQRRAAYRARVEQAVAKEPSDADAQLRYLRLSLDDGKLDQAAATARRIAGLKPAAAVLAAAGRALLEASQYSLAKELLEQAAAAGPSAGVDLDLAVATFHTSGAQEGLQRLDRMPESARSGDYYLVLAQILRASGRPLDADAALDQALRAAPMRSDQYRQAAAFLISSGKAAQAVRLLDRAAGILPGDREILLMNATTLEFALQTSDAENLLAEIERHWPEWPAIWVARGIAMATHGRFEEARRALEMAISLGAHSPEVYYYLADSTLHSAPKDADASAAAIGQALKLAPEDPWILALAAQIALAKGDAATAVERLRESIRLHPSFVHAQALAQAYNALGRKAEAAELEESGVHGNDDPPYPSELFLMKPSRDW